MPRRMIHNAAGVSVSNGDQSQFQCDDNGALLTADHGGKVVTVTPVMETSATAAGDVIAVPIEITGCLRQEGGTVKLTSVLVLDKDDQGQNLDLVFSSEEITLGTLNAAISVSDADAAKIIGHVSVTDYKDYINSQIAVEENLGIIMKGVAGSTSLWVGVVCREGTPTYTASGIVIQLGFEAV